MRLQNENELDLSVIMPCLDEENTVGICIKTVRRFIERYGLSAEIIVVDNGSTDRSAYVSKKLGARVITEKRRGYGRAIRTGIEQSRGSVIIIGDCDTTYDFIHLENFFFPLQRGRYDMIIGNRFAGGIEKGAMPIPNKIGVKFLSLFGRIRYKVSVHDFHCGLRSMTRKAAETIEPHTTGMEFATEMIAEAAKHRLRIGQPPTRLRKCRYKRHSKLNIIRDGCRHFRYMTTGK